MPALSLIGNLASHDRHDDGADAGCGAQQSKPPRAHLQNIAGIDRHQRHRAAEQHGEEIERDGAKHDALAADKAETGQQGCQARLLRMVDLRHGADQQHEERCECQKPEGRAVGCLAADAVEKSAGHGSA